ncbi:MAG: SDR family oxidoreductase, partial [Halobacteria archaeon]|nr:SDR family oxidoreductase [Halobacteria archaeon]
MEGLTAVVTGGTSGIGRSIVHSFCSEGARVVTCSRRKKDVDEVVEEVKEEVDGEVEVMGLRSDVRDEYDTEYLMESASRFGDKGVDVVVANAGIYHGKAGETPLADEPYSVFDDTLRINTRGVFTTVKEALPYMPPDGRVLVPNGEVARNAFPGYGSYAVSKAGAEAVMRQFAAEVDPAVGCVNPGNVATDMTNNQGRDPDEVAGMFVWVATELSEEELNGSV